MPQVFLSYSSHDRDRAQLLAAALENHELDVWWDKEIRTGARVDAVIAQALEDSQLVVVLWSSNSVKSDWVKDEAKRGAESERLLPVAIDETPLPLGFGQFKTTRLSGWRGNPEDPEFRALLRTIRSRLRAPDKKVDRRASDVRELPEPLRHLLKYPHKLRMGYYTLKREIATTARSHVFLVSDHTGEKFVVKCPIKPTKDYRAVRRLQREAEFGIRMDHPNVCPVLDYRLPPFIGLGRMAPGLVSFLRRAAPVTWGPTHERQRPIHVPQGTSIKGALVERHPAYLVMPYLAGRKLSERQAKRPLEPAECVLCLSQIAEGLHHIHEKGIVFCDVKPENIMMVPDRYLKAVVFDFDLAVEYGWHVARDTLTPKNAVIGTLDFLSPEQVQGKRLDPRSDVFQLGVLAHELLTGSLPFEKRTEEEVLLARVHESPTGIRRHDPDLSSELEAVLLKCLARDPEDRYATMLEFRMALLATVGESEKQAVENISKRLHRKHLSQVRRRNP